MANFCHFGLILDKNDQFLGQNGQFLGQNRPKIAIFWKNNTKIYQFLVINGVIFANITLLLQYSRNQYKRTILPKDPP